MVDPTDRDRSISAVAGRQRGAISYPQLRACGGSRDFVRKAVRKERLHRRHRGVYVVGHLAALQFQRETAALLACGHDAVLAGASALYVHGVLPEPPAGQPVQVAIATGQHRDSQPGIHVHRLKAIPPDHISRRHNLPVMRVERALLHLGPHQLAFALDEALAMSKTTRPKLLRLLARHPHPGLEQLLDPRRRGTRTESPAEDELLKLLAEAGLPPPSTQVHLAGFRLDAYYAEANLGLEVHGFGPHGQVRKHAIRDRRKARAMLEQGTTLIELMADELRTSRPELARQIVGAYVSGLATAGAPDRGSGEG